MLFAVQASNQTLGLVSIVELKALPKQTLPSTSVLRQTIISEPDYFPVDEAVIKARVYAKLLYHELKR